MGRGKDNQPPFVVLGQGIPLNSLTTDDITRQAKTVLSNSPDGFVGGITPQTLAVIAHQVPVLGCGFVPGVNAEIRSDVDEPLLHINGNALRFGRPLDNDVLIVLGNVQGGGIRLVHSEGLPAALRLVSGKINGLLEGGMGRIVGAPVRRIQIGDTHLTAEVGINNKQQSGRRRAA